MTSTSLKSYSVVANGRAKKELAVLLYSLRQVSELPIFVFCDWECSDYLSNFDFKSLKIRIGLTEKNLRNKIKQTALVRKVNGFHNREIIACKMDCIKWACEEAGNTLFVDADLIFVADPAESICGKADVMLSPHYPFRKKLADNRKFGVFNAGYLYAGRKEVADIWLEIYLKRSTFYEQQGMIHFFEYFNTKLFDESHNIGFWRWEKSWTRGKVNLGANSVSHNDAISYHAHYFPENYAKADPGLRAGYDKLGELVKSVLPPNIRRFADDL